MSNDFTNLANDDAYRRLASKLHPDHGGDAEAMRDLNALHDEVKSARKFQFGQNANIRPDVQAEEPGPNQEPFIMVPIDGTITPFPRVAAERILQMSPDERANFQAVRNACRVDTIFAGNFLLGMNLSENPHRSFVNFFVHRKVNTPLGDLDPDYKRRLLLAPRGSAKTTFVRADIFSWILLFPNIRVVFLSGSENLAVPQLQAISKGFSQPTPNMLKYFPEYCYLPRSKWNKKQGCWKDVLVGDAIGTMHHFSVPNRTAVHPEPTFQIATPEAVSSGLHSELVYCDDIVNNMTKTVEAHKKAFQNYLDVLPIVMPTGFLFVSGTRYRGGAEPDAYGRIMARAQKETKWRFMVEDCLSTNCNTVLASGLMCGRPECFHDRQINLTEGPSIPGIPGLPCPAFHSDGIIVPFCPVVPCVDGTEYGYTLEFLKMQEDSDQNFYFLQYMNNPGLIQKAKSIFNEQTFGRQTLHTQEQILLKFPPMDSQIFMMVDPAYSDNEMGERRDETVILIFSRRGGDLIFWNSFAGRWGARERTQQIVNALKLYRPVTCFIESNINAESAEILIVDAAHAAGLINVPIASRIPKRAKGSRTIRMENAAQLLETGRVWLYGQLPIYEKLVQQALEYPDGQHDDAADCFAQAIEAAVEVLFLLNTPTAGHQVGPAPLTWLQKLNAPREIESDGTNDGSLFCMTMAVEPASRSHRARLTQVNYALHEASHVAASVYRKLPTSVELRPSVVSCGTASAMTWHVGGTVVDDLFVLSAGLAGSEYFGLGTDGCIQDRADIKAFGRSEETIQRIQSEADAFVADHVDTILKLAYVLSWTGELTEVQTEAICKGTKPVIVPKSFLDAVHKIRAFDWALPTCKIPNETQAISPI